MNLTDIKNKIAKLQAEAERKHEKQIARIIKAVCFYFEIDEKLLKSKRKLEDVCYPRHLMCYLVYQYTIMGHRRVADVLGQNHTTVMSAIKKIKGLIDVGDEKTIVDLGYIIKNFKKSAHVKEKNPYEYRDRWGTRRFKIPPEQHKKPGRPTKEEAARKKQTAFTRPPSEYSNSGHINLVRKLEAI